MTGRAFFQLTLPLLLLAAAGCLPLQSRTSADSTFSAKSSRIKTIDLDRLKPADFPEEIERLEKAIDSANSTAHEKAESQHRLALLYLLPANPHRDLHKGAVALQGFVEQIPDGLVKQENSIWLKLLRDKILQEKSLKELEERSGLATTALEKEKQQLSQQVQDLTDSNARLKQDMEKLKMIDLSVEKKRKSYR
jgi:hypothetical protein